MDLTNCPDYVSSAYYFVAGDSLRSYIPIKLYENYILLLNFLFFLLCASKTLPIIVTMLPNRVFLHIPRKGILRLDKYTI